MKIDIQKSNERGAFDHGWLKTYHSFSFAEYYNPKRMNFGALRVLNEDVIAAGAGFPTHAHDNMEIVTIVLKGKLEHRDSTGGNGVILPNDVQRMSAGKGVRHSEFNGSSKEPVHLLQVWVDTKERDIQPSYEQKAFSESGRKNKLLKVVSSSKNDDALYIHQDAAFYLASLEKGKEIGHRVEYNKGVYVFVINGEVSIDGNTLKTGDAAAATEIDTLKIKATNNSELLVIDVPMKNLD